MKSNIYLAVPESHYDDPVPTLIGQRYPFTEVVNEETITRAPTWREMAEINKPLFGLPIRHLWPYDQQYYWVIEFEASRINGEFDEVEALRTLVNGQPRSRQTDAFFALVSNADYINIAKAIGT